MRSSGQGQTEIALRPRWPSATLWFVGRLARELFDLTHDHRLKKRDQTSMCGLGPRGAVAED